MNTEIIIRPATEADAPALLAIYTPYVTQTAITFEYEPPTVQEFAGRIRDTLKKYPYLVADRQGELVGYAYASQLKGRAAYAWSVETSIYLRQDCRGGGLGQKLYQALEEELKERGFINLYACISATSGEDPLLHNASVKFHKRMGYELVGHFSRCGFKQGRWYDVIWMEKMLGEHPNDPLMPG